MALTFVDPQGVLPDDVLQETLSRTLRLSRIDKPGVARVLDVVHTRAGGLVVAEWIRGGSLQEVADTSPSPVGAIRAMQSLAAAADAAHRAGVALSIDHPSRVRVSIDGDVVLAYPATMPDANPQDDIRGIGASCTPCWSAGGRCRRPACAAGWHPPSATPLASPSNPPTSTVTSPSRFPRWRPGRFKETAGYAARQRC